MKKRIIGLFLALCLIVGLLPLTVLAEDAGTGTVKKVAITTKNGHFELEDGTFEENKKEWTENFAAPVYGKTSADGLTIDWEKATASDYNIAISQSAAGLEIELKNANLKLTRSHQFAIWVEYDGPLTIKLTGKNDIYNEKHNSPACLFLRAKSTVITGGGSLSAYSQGYSSSAKFTYIDGTEQYCYDYAHVIDCDNDLTIKDVTLNLKTDSTSGDPWAPHGIRCSGNVVIDHANVDIYSEFGTGLMLATKRLAATATVDKNITIINGSKVNIDSKGFALRVGTKGTLTIDTANGTELNLKSAAAPFNKTPVWLGNGDVDMVAGMQLDGSDAKAYTRREANQAVAAYKEMLYFAMTHNHTGGTATCAKKAVCTICNEEYGEQPAHTYTRTDCSKDSVCSVCNQVVVKAGAHTGGTATCTAKAKCDVCKVEYGELAAHTGGTATCVAKAKCDVCKAEYGELGAHVPETDDKDCTTEQKCTLCKTVLAAAKEHKFLNDKDKSCENQGCAYVRGSDTPTTNPNTGDISVLLTAAVALSSAVGFAGITVLRKKEN